VVDVRIYGKAVLTIDHGDYAVRGVPLPTASAEIR
jgi:hypothetical protein